MAESKVFKLMNGVNGEALCMVLEGFLREEYQMIVQSGKTTGGYIVQGKQESDAWKKYPVPILPLLYSSLRRQIYLM